MTDDDNRWVQAITIISFDSPQTPDGIQLFDDMCREMLSWADCLLYTDVSHDQEIVIEMIHTLRSWPESEDSITYLLTAPDRTRLDFMLREIDTFVEEVQEGTYDIPSRIHVVHQILG